MYVTQTQGCDVPQPVPQIQSEISRCHDYMTELENYIEALHRRLSPVMGIPDAEKSCKENILAAGKEMSPVATDINQVSGRIKGSIKNIISIIDSLEI